jgi:cytochrome b subunit of formate dehydrogenase
MKRSDLGIVIIHWAMVITLLGTAVSGVLLWQKEWKPYASAIFPPENVGVIHIGLSVAVVVLLLIYFGYVRYKNFQGRAALRFHLVAGGRILWKYVSSLLYWALFIIVLIETVTGILLTKLINQDTLAKIFFIEKTPLQLVHLYLVLAIFVFPVVHVIVHVMDRRVLSMFRPRFFPRRPSLADITAALKEENVRLKKEKARHESPSSSSGIDVRGNRKSSL